MQQSIGEPWDLRLKKELVSLARFYPSLEEEAQSSQGVPSDSSPHPAGHHAAIPAQIYLDNLAVNVSGSELWCAKPG